MKANYEGKVLRRLLKSKQILTIANAGLRRGVGYPYSACQGSFSAAPF